MNYIKAHCLIAVVLITSYCNAQDCATMPIHFPSYDAAISFVRRASFKLNDAVRTYSTSWLIYAEYYCCDGYRGIFIFTTDKGYEYIMKDVPISVWRGFKNASDYGVYYNQHIRAKYHFPL